MITETLTTALVASGLNSFLAAYLADDMLADRNLAGWSDERLTKRALDRARDYAIVTRKAAAQPGPSTPGKFQLGTPAGYYACVARGGHPIEETIVMVRREDGSLDRDGVDAAVASLQARFPGLPVRRDLY